MAVLPTPDMHEAYFYQHLAPRLEHTGARVPCCLHAENSLDESHEGGRMAMLLEDLRPAYPRSIGGALTLAQAKVCDEAGRAGRAEL